MTLTNYRILHSQLIELYQWIEFDLEDLYAALSGDPFHKALQEIERDSIGGVVREIRRIENKRKITVFSDAEYAQLDQIRERRNFWCHVCYTEAYDDHTGAPANAILLPADLHKAQEILTWLRQIKDMYMRQ